MKKILYFLLIFQICTVNGSWIIVQVNNKTDLSLSKAVRNNGVAIDSISQIFQNSQNQKSIKIPADLLFGTSSECKIIGKSLKTGDEVTFLFFGDVTYRVANGRAPFADLDSRNAAAVIKQSNMARVFQMQSSAVMKLIGTASFDQEGQRFALTISGSLGNYQAQLTPIK